jgi:hypothetical protein
MSEDDERGGTPFSMGRTLSLSDGIFAIAMTLPAFQVPPADLHGDQERHLAQALADLSSRYWISPSAWRSSASSGCLITGSSATSKRSTTRPPF